MATRINQERQFIGGLMMESFLVEGNQRLDSTPLCYGQSITDACIGWDDTERHIDLLANALA